VHRLTDESVKRRVRRPGVPSCVPLADACKGFRIFGSPLDPSFQQNRPVADIERQPVCAQILQYFLHLAYNDVLTDLALRLGFSRADRFIYDGPMCGLIDRYFETRQVFVG